MATQRRVEEENPFMAVALAPLNKGVATPDMAKPKTREEQAVLNKHHVDMFKEAGKIEKAVLAIEGINTVNEHAVTRFQEGQNFMSELEQATAEDKRVTVEHYNRALSTAAGNGTIQVMKHLVDGLNKIVDDDDPFKPLPVPAPPAPPPPPPTVENVKVRFGDFWRGYIPVKTHQ